MSIFNFNNIYFKYIKGKSVVLMNQQQNDHLTEVLVTVINSIIILEQNEQNSANNTDSTLLKSIALAQVDAYRTTISLLQQQLASNYCMRQY